MTEEKVSQNEDKDLMLAEYNALKAEQTQRIVFRDNMIFVHLAACGAVGSWAVSNLNSTYSVSALLIIPWISVVLGWTYVANDHAISRIGRYVRWVMNERSKSIARFDAVAVKEEDGKTASYDECFAWEPFHRKDSHRNSRKKLQCAVDLLTFCVPGMSAIVGFLYITSKARGLIVPLWIICASEFILLISLAVAIVVYADIHGETEQTARRITDTVP